MATSMFSFNHGLSAHPSIDLKRQVQAGGPGTVIGKTVEKMEGLLAASGASLVYAGYPYDPFALDAPKG